MFFENILPYRSSKPISYTPENKKRHAINCIQDSLSKYKTCWGSVNIFKSHLNIAMTRWYTTGFVKRPKHLQRNYVSGRGFYTLICCSFLCDRFQGNSLTVLALVQPWVATLSQSNDFKGFMHQCTVNTTQPVCEKTLPYRENNRCFQWSQHCLTRTLY